MQPLLCMNQEYFSALKFERLPLLKGQTQIFSQNWIEFNINRHGFIPKCAMARQWLFDISYLLRRFTHDSYAWWTHEIISYNHGIYSFILVYFNKRFFLTSILS